MNLLLASVALTLLVGWLAVGPQGGNLSRNLAIFLFTGGWLNILLAFFNLLPIPPLDGSSILAGLSVRAYRFYAQPQAAMIGMFFLLAVIYLTPLGGLIWGGSQVLAMFFVDVPGALFGNPRVLDVVYSVR